MNTTETFGWTLQSSHDFKTVELEFENLKSVVNNTVPPIFEYTHPVMFPYLLSCVGDEDGYSFSGRQVYADDIIMMSYH